MADGTSSGGGQVIERSGLGDPGAHRLDDGAQVANADPLLQQPSQHGVQGAEREVLGADLVGEDRLVVSQALHQQLDVLAGEQSRGVAPDHLCQVGHHHRRAINHRRTGGGRLGPDRARHPEGGEAEHRLDRLHRSQAAQGGTVADRHGQNVAGRCRAHAHLGAPQHNRVGLGVERHVVARADRRHDDSQIHCDLLAQGPHPFQQIPALGGVDQVEDVVGQVQLERLYPHGSHQRLRIIRIGGHHRRRLVVRLVQVGGGGPGREGEQGSGDAKERNLRQSRQQGQAADAERRQPHRPGIAEQLQSQFAPHVVVGADPGHQQTGGERNEQGRYLADQAVADRES